MKKLLEKYQSLSNVHKIQIVLALVLTISTMIALPVAAWFTNQRQLAELQAIKTPDLLYITAANAEDVKYFQLSKIDVTETDENDDPITHKLYPFCVAGEYVTRFTLQMAHTTNNPFTYKIYEADAYTTLTAAQSKANSTKDIVEYTVHGKWKEIELNFSQREDLDDGEKLWLVKGNCLAEGESSKAYEGKYLNMKADGTADSTYHEECYGTYSKLTAYEEPLYWQCDEIPSVTNSSGWGAKPFFKTFILEVSWQSSAKNEKETDIVYISAYRG